MRRVSEALLNTAQNRLELLSVEAQEEKWWLVSALLWIGATLFVTFLSVVLVVGTIVYLSPDPARPWVLIGFCLVFLGLTASGFAGLRKLLRERPAPFADSIAELKKDISWIRSQD